MFVRQVDATAPGVVDAAAVDKDTMTTVNFEFGANFRMTHHLILKN